VTQAANQIFGVTAAQLAQTTFVPAANASEISWSAQLMDIYSVGGRTCTSMGRSTMRRW
jgi:hypothetical protein